MARSSSATLAAGEAEEIGPRVIREQLAAYIDAGEPADRRPRSRPAGQRGIGPARRRPPAKGQSAGVLSREALPKKTEYKPGWAKPKKAADRRPKAARPAASRRRTAGRAQDEGAVEEPGPAKTPDPLGGPKPRQVT